MLFACGMLVGLIFLFFVPREAAGRLQLVYAQVFRWPLAMTSGVVRVQTTSQVRNVSPQEYEKLLGAYQELRNNLANLQAQNEQTKDLLERLTKLRAMPGLERMEPIPAGVIMHVQDELTINRGRDSGVAVGQYVLSLTNDRLNDQCVVGIVSAVYDRSAKVKLLTAPDCRIPVGIAGLDVPKLLEGRGDGAARILLVPHSHALHAGDWVYAEKKPGFLDAPVVLAEIEQCRRDAKNPLVWDITARPACDLAILSEVAVLKSAAAP